MNIKVKNTNSIEKEKHIVFLTSALNLLPKGILTRQESEYLKKQPDEKNALTFFHINRLNQQVIVCLTPEKNEDENFIFRERIRKLGSKTANVCKNEDIGSLQLVAASSTEQNVLDFLEGLMLTLYSFDKYKSKKSDKKNIRSISVHGVRISAKNYSELTEKVQIVFTARNWVNEPGSTLTPLVFVQQVKELFSAVPEVKLEVLSAKKISSLKMAGMEAVSKGGPNTPAFIILEYIPKKTEELNPFVLVGKGIFFDTGGINLKPGPALADMKCDMSGASAVAATMFLIARMKIDIPVVGLIPATENRPGNIAYLPGDILTMMNGLTVEIKNTDAEGRLILADALCYAKKFKPALTITLATLTGSAHASFGQYAIAGMQNKADFYFSLLKSASFDVFERIAELPMWEEYEDMLESQVADMQNIGGKYAGAITAAKFLQKFTDYPFIHLDIAGPAFYEKTDSYIPSGGTGIGIRLLYDFFKKIKAMY